MSAVLEVGKMNGTLRNGVPEVVHWMLQCWARWAKSNSSSLGWPEATLLARVIEYGPSGASTGGSPPITMPPDVAEVDSILAKMPKDLNTVLVTHYLRWLPQEEKAKECGVSLSKYRSQLQAAQWYVYARLSNT